MELWWVTWHIWSKYGVQRLLQRLQVQQNRAARIVTKSGWYTSTKVLLTQTGWLSVKQLIEFHSLLLVYKMRKEGKPVYFQDKFWQQSAYKTRLCKNNGLTQSSKIKSDLYKQSFVPRSSFSWNKLPATLRLSPTLKSFKKQLKKWVREKVPIK